MNAPEIVVRPSAADDFDAWFELYESVAAEGKWIGGESPSDRDARKRGFDRFLDADDAVSLVADANGELVGGLGIEVMRFGTAELGMQVRGDWRGRGVGSALMRAAVDWARNHGAHKMTLTVWPHNDAARALYRKFGFVEEGRLSRHYRRRNGELWDAIAMGLILDTTSPGNPHDT